METRIGIKQEYLGEVAAVLCKVLSDEFIVYTKTRNAHWNVEGPDFYSKHIFFEQQYTQLEDIIDATAERIRTIGHYASASLKEYLSLTHLSEQLREKNDGTGYIKELLEDHESITVYMREYLNNFITCEHDQGSVDYISGLMKTHEKMAWMLRAHLR